MAEEALVLDLISLNDCRHVSDSGKVWIRLDIARCALRILRSGNVRIVCVSKTQHRKYYRSLVRVLKHPERLGLAGAELGNILVNLADLLSTCGLIKVGKCKEYALEMKYCDIRLSGRHREEYEELLCAMAKCFYRNRSSCLIMCSGRSFNFDELVSCAHDLSYGGSCKLVGGRRRHEVVVCCLPGLPRWLDC